MKECAYLEILPKATLEIWCVTFPLKCEECMYDRGVFIPIYHTTMWRRKYKFSPSAIHMILHRQKPWMDLTWGCLVFFQSYSCHWSNHRSCESIFNALISIQIVNENTYEIGGCTSQPNTTNTKQGSYMLLIHASPSTLEFLFFLKKISCH